MFDLTPVSPVCEFTFSIKGKARVKKHQTDSPTFSFLFLFYLSIQIFLNNGLHPDKPIILKISLS